ncbi:hypothetical protein GOEFS_127_00090 [Gordonia effusa NBRC 100432]|uniref:Lipid droplet-associated protein n=1 Tax=Gordonia effusa NBRC 100432 TaxID=1077974 RepID=H0R6M5_9ACTN|nr:lipid droplet-associated protein [Gordonia effusa]GAB20726.1 hypothetical protein GOEFS_127_00090 [Gordonia effusa NBRC 100432]
MIRPPYTARVAAGLLATVVEETRKLPTYAVTLPMTAVSQALQAGMRMQQNVAELAIKGDTVFDGLFGKTEEQPSWAVFDEDSEATPPATEKLALVQPVDTPTSAPAAPAPVAAKPTTTPTKRTKPAADQPEAAKATKAAAKAPAKTAPAKATKAAAKRAKPAATKSTTTKPKAAAKSAGPSASNGRFALYSSAPDDVTSSKKAAPAKTDDAAFDGIVGELDYDALTLAQLRAKLRVIELEDLRTLATYEKANRARTPFLTMLENRIATKSEK